MPRKHLSPFNRPGRYFGPLSHKRPLRRPAVHQTAPTHDVPHPGRLLSIAYTTHRPCRCNSYICLTPEERAYERRVFRLAKAWSRMLAGEAKVPKQGSH